MQTLLARKHQNMPKEVSVGANECRLAKHGERLVARDVLTDVVLAIQVPAGGFAAMLRFSVPEERNVSSQQIETLWNFADQAITLLFQNIWAMDLPKEDITVFAMGGADVSGRTFGRGKQLALAVRRSLWKHGIVLKGNDLGGVQKRLVWLDSSSGRLIVRSTSPKFDLAEELQSGGSQKHKAS
jgi:chemotaxis receptor (MCP) glutamine deamidase CheD